MTLYERLQVDKNASKEVIIMAYKALAKMYHPDINSSHLEIMKEINHAKEVLTDDNLREEYDREMFKTENQYTTSIHSYNDSNNQSNDSTQDWHQFEESSNLKKYMSKNIGIGMVTFAVIIIIVIVGSLLDGYSNITPEKATKSFFKAISMQNIDEVTNLIENDELKSMLNISGFRLSDFKEQLGEAVISIDEEAEDEFGKNWHKKVKVVDVDEEDGYAEVTVEIGDDEESMYLYESKGKWYINFYDMF